MRRIFLIFILIMFAIPALSISVFAQEKLVPAKLVPVKTGNGNTAPVYDTAFKSAYNPLNKIPRYIIPDGSKDYNVEITANAFWGILPIFLLVEGKGSSNRTAELIMLNAVFEKTTGFKIPPPNNKFKILFSGVSKPGQPRMKEYNPTVQILDGDGKKLVEYESVVEPCFDGIRFVNPANSEQNVELVKKDDRIIFQTHLYFYFKDSAGKTTATVKNLKLVFSDMPF